MYTKAWSHFSCPKCLLLTDQYGVQLCECTTQVWHLWCLPRVADVFTLSWQFMSQYFVCLGDFYFISIISFSVFLSEDPESNLSSSSDSHTPQRRPPRFWLNDPTAAVASNAKCCTIFHVFSHPILPQHSYSSSSEQACLPPAKDIIYITVLQRKHNHCFLWKTPCQGIMGAICFSYVPVQTMRVEWPEEEDVRGREVRHRNGMRRVWWWKWRDWKWTSLRSLIIMTSLQTKVGHVYWRRFFSLFIIDSVRVTIKMMSYPSVLVVAMRHPADMEKHWHSPTKRCSVRIWCCKSSTEFT